jgi:hypothetical protein
VLCGNGLLGLDDEDRRRDQNDEDHNDRDQELNERDSFVTSRK